MALPLRLAGRHDGLLLAAFAFALLVVFERSIRYVLEIAREVESSHGVALMPALLILSVVFVFHQHVKRHESKVEAVTAAAEARQARERSQELEQLVVFGQALARALTIDELREVLWRHLPRFVDDHDGWVLAHAGGRWDELVNTGFKSPETSAAIEALATAALSQDARALQRPEGSEHDGHVCFPMVVGGRAVGVMGVAFGAGGLSSGRRRMVAAAAALLAIAVRNVQLFAEVRDRSVRDELTGCFNRAHALEALDGELRRATRSDQPLSILMIDLDHFKTINDQHGHICGDEVLRTVGARLREVLRRSDIPCRYGGDEFLVVLPETALHAARHVADWLRHDLEDVVVKAGDTRVPLKVSIGVAASGSADTEITAFIERADTAMYRAKNGGRNCVRESEGAEPWQVRAAS